MTPWVTRLIFLNVAVFFLQAANPGLTGMLAFGRGELFQAPWTLITYMFAHAGFGHIFFNMLSLYFFGPRVELRLGGRRFLYLYFIAGITGAVLHALMVPYGSMIGASGATFGVTFAFAYYWPREPIYLYGVIGVEARMLVIFYTVISLFNGAAGGGSIAHFAHLGGYLGGWLYLKWAESRTPAAEWKAKVTPPPPPVARLDTEKWRKVNLAGMHPVNREEYERVLAKLDTQGPTALSPGDIEFLERFSRS